MPRRPGRRGGRRRRSSHRFKRPKIDPGTKDDAREDMVRLRATVAIVGQELRVEAPIARPFFSYEESYRLFCPFLELEAAGPRAVSAFCRIQEDACSLFVEGFRDAAKPDWCKGTFIKFPAWKGWTLFDVEIDGEKYPIAFLNKAANFVDHVEMERRWPPWWNIQTKNPLEAFYENLERGAIQLALTGVLKPGHEAIHTALSRPKVGGRRAEVIAWPMKRRDPITGTLLGYEGVGAGRLDLILDAGGDKIVRVNPLATHLIAVRRLPDLPPIKLMYLELLKRGHVAKLNAKRAEIIDVCIFRRKQDAPDKMTPMYISPKYGVRPLEGTSPHDREVLRLYQQYLVRGARGGEGHRRE